VLTHAKTRGGSSHETGSACGGGIAAVNGLHLKSRLLKRALSNSRFSLRARVLFEMAAAKRKPRGSVADSGYGQKPSQPHPRRVPIAATRTSRVSPDHGRNMRLLVAEQVGRSGLRVATTSHVAEMQNCSPLSMRLEGACWTPEAIQSIWTDAQAPAAPASQRGTLAAPAPGAGFSLRSPKSGNWVG